MNGERAKKSFLEEKNTERPNNILRGNIWSKKNLISETFSFFPFFSPNTTRVLRAKGGPVKILSKHNGYILLPLFQVCRFQKTCFWCLKTKT